jgi:mannose-6-phosphate isomerase
MLHVRAAIKHYAWGSTHALAELAGTTPDGRPWAELWFGTHPDGPAVALDGEGGARPLVEAVGPLPFLAKLIAAAEPLSLQTHPDEQRAREGYRREEATGIDRDDPHRQYRDAGAKPELLVALGPFEALCGIAPTVATVALLRRLGEPAAGELADRLERDGPGPLLRTLLVDRPPVVATLATACRRVGPRLDAHSSAHLGWVARLAERYPEDPAVAVALLLNYTVLAPGEALALAPGNLHAYLQGVGFEVMAPSDNVIRGGLTGKPVAPTELVSLVDHRPLAHPVVRGRPTPSGLVYSVPTIDVHAERVSLPAATSLTTRVPGLLVVVAGRVAGAPAGDAVWLDAADTVRADANADVFVVTSGPFVPVTTTRAAR